MSSKTYRAGLWVAVLAIVATGPLSAQDQKKDQFKETYEAFAVAMGTSNPPVIPSGLTTTIQINITRWTTDEERADLFAVLIEKGQDSLVNAIQKQQETGFVRVIGRGAGMTAFPSQRLRYAREFNLPDGKRRIVCALDRPISFYEARNQPRWRDYDMTLIVLDVDQNGNGEGELAMGVRLSVDTERKTLVIENFGTEPVRLNKVHRRK